MVTRQTTQTDLLCPTCAGQRLFDPDAGALKCESCGAGHQLDGPGDDRAVLEIPYDPAQPQPEPIAPQDISTHHCQTCGGDVVFAGPSVSERCPYCDGPIVRHGNDTAYDTMAVVPFAVSRKTAIAQAHRWASERLAAPNSLMVSVQNGRMAGLYAPFWTFDSKELVNYWAQQRKRSGKRTVFRRITGKMTTFFDDMLVPASTHVSPLIRDGILHRFEPARLRPFRAGYLSGFAAELHHQTVAEGLKANAADKDLLIRNRIRRHINRSGIVNIGYRTDTTGIHYRRILLPVWILHYQHGDTPMKIVVSGINGRVFGERPFSLAKLLLLSAGLSVAALLLGVAWGVGSLP